MIRERLCLTLRCDDCKADIEIDNDGTTMHYDTAADAREAGDTYEAGYCGPDGDFCRKCVLKPHGFVEDPDDPDGCYRCQVDKGEHDGAPAGIQESETAR